ncbi:hypothetical protein [Bradyrhizobium sp. SZCCHNRI2010]|uniref:hypothetical protein n=1 Tax=Bradyrhizobium sp. SZCCHNRI2010 TaxID=3057283 RepID=UPI0028E4B4D3|nr:hypothetical protein [Bradyrhizobium sp. SZCCHNRI2010]
MASTAGTIIPLAAMDGAPKSMPTGGNQPPAASTAGVPLPITDRGTPAGENASAYASAIARRGMHSVGAPAKGPRGTGMEKVGPISSK